MNNDSIFWVCVAILAIYFIGWNRSGCETMASPQCSQHKITSLDDKPGIYACRNTKGCGTCINRGKCHVIDKNDLNSAINSASGCISCVPGKHRNASKGYTCTAFRGN